MIQDREHIVISRRQVFDELLNALIAGTLYLLLYWVFTFPARRDAHYLQLANNEVRQEIDRTRIKFTELNNGLLELSKDNTILRSQFLLSIDSYIRALEVIRDGKNLPKMDNDGDLTELYAAREQIKYNFVMSKQLTGPEVVVEPQFELMLPPSAPDKSTSQPQLI